MNIRYPIYEGVYRILTKYVRDYEVEIETTPDKRWQSEARQKEKQSKKPMPKEFKKIKKYKDPFYWAAFILLDAID